MVRPPLRDVAQLAGVSEPTVSRVLNGRPGVAEPTRMRVVQALAELGFTSVPGPEPKRSGMVGLITGELTNPVFGELSHTITARLARHGLVTTIGVAARSMTSEERYVEQFLASGVDGLVVLAGAHSTVDADIQLYQRVIERQVALVLVNGAHIGLDIPYIWSDESLGAQKAVEHLCSFGHQRIGALIGHESYVGSVRHRLGFRRAMQAAGLEEIDGAISGAPFTREGGVAGARRLIDLGITGVLCANDLMALGAMTAALQAGLDVPRDFSVVGYDGTEISAISAPALTTLRQPFEDMGDLVADALVSEIEGSGSFRDTYVFAPDLIMRSSTGPRNQTGSRSEPGASAFDIGAQHLLDP